MSQQFTGTPGDTLPYCAGDTDAFTVPFTWAMKVKPANDQSVSSRLYIYGGKCPTTSSGQQFYVRNYTGVDLGLVWDWGAGSTSITTGYTSGVGFHSGQIQWTTTAFHTIMVTGTDAGGGNTTLEVFFDNVSLGTHTHTANSMSGWKTCVGNLADGGGANPNNYAANAEIAHVVVDTTAWDATKRGYYQAGVDPALIAPSALHYWQLLGSALTDAGSSPHTLVQSSSPHNPTTGADDPLIYTPRVSLCRVLPSGMMIETKLDNSQGGAVSATNVNSNATITINGGSSITLTGSSAGTVNTGVYQVWTIPIGTTGAPIAAGDTVTFSVASGALSTALGGTVAYSGACDSSLGTVSGKPVASVFSPTNYTSLKLAYNAPSIGLGSVNLLANLAKMSGGLPGQATGNGKGTTVPGRDTSDGFPTFSGPGTAFQNCIFTTPGSYVLKWDSSAWGDCYLGLSSPNSDSYVSASDTNRSTDLSRTYHVAETQGLAIYYQLGRYVDPCDSSRMTYTGTWTLVTGSGLWNVYKVNSAGTGTAVYDLGVIPSGAQVMIGAYYAADAANTAHGFFSCDQGATNLGVIAVDFTLNSSGANIGDDVAVTNRNITPLFTVAPTGSTATKVTLTRSSGTGALIAPTLHAFITDASGVTFPSGGFKPVTNVRLYSPETNPSSPTTAHPLAVTMLDGTPYLRTMQLLQINGSFVQNANQFALSTDRTYGSGSDKTGSSAFPVLTITRIDPDTDDDNFFGTQPNPYTPGGGRGYTLAKVTTSGPHGFETGIAPTVLFDPINVGTGSNLNSNVTTIWYKAGRHSTSQFTVANNTATQGTFSAITSPAYSGGPALVYPLAQTIALDDLAKSASDVPGMGLYFLIPTNSTQSAIEFAADTLDANLASGRPIICSYSNEPANGAFNQASYFQGRAWNANALANSLSGAAGVVTPHGTVSSLAGSEAGRQYAICAHQAIKWFTDRLISNGSSRTVYWGYEAWISNINSFNTQMLAELTTLGAQLDYMFVAPYYLNSNEGQYSMPDYRPMIESWNVEQLFDTFELSVFEDINSNRANAIAQNNALQAYTGSGLKRLGGYEFALEKGAMGTNTLMNVGNTAHNVAVNNHRNAGGYTLATIAVEAINGHPRVAKLLKGLFSKLAKDDSGATLFTILHYYSLYGVISNEGDVDSFAHIYQAYDNATQPPGVGASGEGYGGAYDPLPDLWGASTLAGALPLGVLGVPNAFTVNVTGGGTGGGSLAAGAYYAYITEVSSAGENVPGPEVGPFTVGAGNIPRVTFGAMRPGNTSRVLYLTPAGGGSGSEVLYVGSSAATVDLTSAVSGSTTAPTTTPAPLQRDMSRAVSYFGGEINAWNSFTSGGGPPFVIFTGRHKLLFGAPFGGSVQ